RGVGDPCRGGTTHPVRRVFHVGTERGVRPPSVVSAELGVPSLLDTGRAPDIGTVKGPATWLRADPTPADALDRDACATFRPRLRAVSRTRLSTTCAGRGAASRTRLGAVSRSPAFQGDATSRGATPHGAASIPT